MSEPQVTPPEKPQTVTYWAISFFSSKTVWFNFFSLVLASLQLTEVVTLIPLRYLPLQAAVVAIINGYIRTQTVRPVAFISPKSTTPVDVPKIDPPPPSLIGD